jgi:hypothetical protein
METPRNHPTPGVGMTVMFAQLKFTTAGNDTEKDGNFKVLYDRRPRKRLE